jgi:hypothetical protein
MTILKLNYSQYLATMTSPMVNVTETASPAIDIWPLVQNLVELQLVPKIVIENNLVEAVYRDKTESYDHILLPTNQSNKFICLIVNIHERKAKGYYLLDLAGEYGLQEQIETVMPPAKFKNIHEDETQALLSLRQVTATEAYKSDGSTRVKEISFTPWETPAARFVFEVFIDDFSIDVKDILPDKWEITCSDVAVTDGVPLYLYPRAQIKLFDDHPILLAFDDEIFFSVIGKPNSISALMGDLFIEHSKACGNWVDFQWLYRGLPGAFDLTENQLAIPARLKDACFLVLERHGVQYKINCFQENEKGYRVLFFSYEAAWPDNENFKQSYIIAKDFSERKLP